MAVLPQSPTELARYARQLEQRLEKLERGGVDKWHEIGATGEPAFENSWVNYGGGFATAAFYKDPYGIVHLQGLVKSGTVATTIFTLPTGYRPAGPLIFIALNNTTLVDLRIDGGGLVVPNGGNNTWLSLDGITFRAT